MKMNLNILLLFFLVFYPDEGCKLTFVYSFLLGRKMRKICGISDFASWCLLGRIMRKI